MPVSNVVDANLYDAFWRQGLKLENIAKTVAAEEAIATSWPPVLLLDPNGGAKTVLLPAEADSEGLTFVIFNTADAAEVLTVEEDSSTTAILTLAQGEGGLVYCDGTTWHGMMVGTNT